MGQNLTEVPPLRDGQDVVLPIERPIKPTGAGLGCMSCVC
jgi:hypothetical protein